jgi:hypothetical protein
MLPANASYVALQWCFTDFGILEQRGCF